jgi:hypothetical protein
MKTQDVERLLQWAVIGGIVYVAYKALGGIEKIGAGAVDMGNQAAEVLDFTADPNNQTFSAWYDPRIRNVFFYWLTFPDGVHHWVWSSNVQTDGTFVFDDGQRYRIGVDRAGGLRAYGYSA